MYDIHFRRDYNTPDTYVLTRRYLTLECAKNGRVCSGDLVVHARTNKVVADPSWLWDWEKKNKNCYAQRAIKHDNV